LKRDGTGKRKASLTPTLSYPNRAGEGARGPRSAARRRAGDKDPRWGQKKDPRRGGDPFFNKEGKIPGGLGELTWPVELRSGHFF
jgi:hypothetical protein